MILSMDRTASMIKPLSEFCHFPNLFFSLGEKVSMEASILSIYTQK